MSKLLNAHFAAKPCNLSEVTNPANLECQPDLIEIQATRSLPREDFDAFAANLLADRFWLDGFGGVYLDPVHGPVRRVVEVVAPDRPTLYVDPSGYRYARYVALAV